MAMKMKQKKEKTKEIKENSIEEIIYFAHI
jgi:hypothetical protein